MMWHRSCPLPTIDREPFTRCIFPCKMQIPVQQIRWNCVTSCHTRRMHFTTWTPSLISYFTTGIGVVDVVDLKKRWKPLTGHTAFLPWYSGHGLADQGDTAMTEDPFRSKGAYGLNTVYWMMDSVQEACSVHFTIWVRSFLGSINAPQPPPGKCDTIA